MTSCPIIGVRGGGQRRHPNGSTFFNSPQTCGCACAARKRVRGRGFPARPSARELPPRSQPGAATELWFLSWWWCPVSGVRSRIPPGGPAPGGRKPPFSPKRRTLGPRMVNFHENGAFPPKIGDFHENVRFGPTWGSGAISVPARYGFRLGFHRVGGG